MKYTVYVLRLQKGKFYVGLTPSWRLSLRESEHTHGVGAKWTTRYPPIELMDTWEFNTKREGGLFEIKKTEEYLHLHGIDSTRGGLCNYGKEGGYKYWVRRHLRHLIPTAKICPSLILNHE